MLRTIFYIRSIDKINNVEVILPAYDDQYAFTTSVKQFTELGIPNEEVDSDHWFYVNVENSDRDTPWVIYWNSLQPLARPRRHKYQGMGQV